MNQEKSVPRVCPQCKVDIQGQWARCPLCGAITHNGTAGRADSPLPTIPLTFSRRRMTKVLLLVSVAVVLASFGLQLVFHRGTGQVGALRSIWLGVAAMWLVVLMAVRKRGNIAKGTVYLVVLVGLVTAYWDYLTGWHGWSLTYVVPIVCAFSIVALLIAVRMMRMEVGDYTVYTGLTVLLGLVPILFLVLGWVRNPIASAICIGVAAVALVVQILTQRREVGQELAKRLRL